MLNQISQVVSTMLSNSQSAGDSRYATYNSDEIVNYEQPRNIMMISQCHSFTSTLSSSYQSNVMVPRVMLPDKADLLERCVLRKFESLMTADYLFYSTYRVISGIVMVVNQDWSKLVTVALGTGSKFVRASSTWAGDIIDCHAEVVARRAFVKFLMKELEYAGKPNTIYGVDQKLGIYYLNRHVEFYLYISTAPCGDARVLSHGLNEDLSSEVIAKAAAVLRRKGKNALTVRADTTDSKFEAASMSCSDKILKWNVVGAQGSLLSKFLTDPIYFTGICIGDKFDQNHFRRAIYDRVVDKIGDMPDGYRLTIPELHGVRKSSADPVRVFQPTHSVNWYHGCSGVEVINALKGKIKLGHCFTPDGRQYSQISKYAIFAEYQQHFARVFEKPPCFVYKSAKSLSYRYQLALAAFFRAVKESQLGKWVEKSPGWDQFPLYTTTGGQQASS